MINQLKRMMLEALCQCHPHLHVKIFEGVRDVIIIESALKDYLDIYSMVPLKGSTQRFPSKVPLKGSTQMFPSNVPLKGSPQRSPSEVPLKDSPQRFT